MAAGRFLVLVLSVLAALVATPSRATIWTVQSGADAGGTCPGASCTLRQAIASAAAGDTVRFAPALTAVDLTSGELLVNKSLTISGPGASLLVIRRSASAGTALFRVIHFSSGVSVLSGVTVSNGNVAGDGAGVYSSGTTLTIDRSTISGNTATSSGNSGGGVTNGGGGIMTISNSIVSGNFANGTGNGAGGGIANSCAGCSFGGPPGPQLTIVNSTVSGNSAVYGGGGVWNDPSGTITITNSTISGNQAQNGGGIMNVHQLTMNSSTVTGNTSLAGGSGGGFNQFGGTSTARNSIIALNTGASQPDVSGPLATQGFNIIGVNSGMIVPTTGDRFDITAAQLALGPLQDNGGPTPTHALLSGSIAIEAGHSSGSGGTDQRGLARPVDSTVLNNATGGDGSDIGAYEVQADILPGCANVNRIVTNGDDSGAESLRDVLSKVCAGSTITFAPNITAVTLTSGQLSITKSLTISGPGADLLNIQRSAAGGTPTFRVFGVGTNNIVKIAGVSVTNGRNPGLHGGGIMNAGTLTLEGVDVSGNASGNGGGIYNSATLNLIGSTLSANSVSDVNDVGSGGGIFNFGGTLNIIGS